MQDVLEDFYAVSNEYNYISQFFCVYKNYLKFVLLPMQKY